MSAMTVVLLAGLFAIPAGLLWLGHRLKRRPPRHRSAFWGALWGYFISGLLALYAGMSPPASWGPADAMRGWLGYGSLVLLRLVGGLIGLLRGRAES
jgi:uncharacterized membrane protein HdeD (DUF308 family)